MNNIGHQAEEKLNSLKFTHFFEWSAPEAKIICKRRDECGCGEYLWPIREDRLRGHVVDYHGGLLGQAEEDRAFFNHMRGVQAEGVTSSNAKSCWIANATNIPLMVSALPNRGGQQLGSGECTNLAR